MVDAHLRISEMDDRRPQGMNRITHIFDELGVDNGLLKGVVGGHRLAWSQREGKTPELASEYSYGFTLGVAYGIAFAQALQRRAEEDAANDAAGGVGE